MASSTMESFTLVHPIVDGDITKEKGHLDESCAFKMLICDVSTDHCLPDLVSNCFWIKWKQEYLQSAQSFGGKGAISLLICQGSGRKIVKQKVCLRYKKWF